MEVRKTREYYIDNIRTIIILSLFIWHTCEIYHCKEGFYIEGRDSLIPTLAYNFVSAWVMGVLFFIAGKTTMYSLKKRTIKEYYKDRFARLFKPFLFGLFFWVPIIAYWTMKCNVGYKGSFLGSYRYFFTNFDSQFYGYEGRFSPVHLWFLLFLFCISLLAYPFIRLKQNKPELLSNVKVVSLPLILVFSLFVEAICYGSTDETFIRYYVFFVLGILLFDNKHLQDYSQKNWMVLSISTLVLNLVTAYLCVLMKDMQIFSVQYLVSRYIWSLSSIVACLASLGVGQKFLNKQGKIMKYLSAHSFSIYFIHMVVLVTIAYFVVMYAHLAIWMEMLVIFIVSIIMTFITLEIFRKIPLICWMFEIK